jgi:hypothetical protein
MPGSMPGARVVRWALDPSPDGRQLILLVVDDGGDDELTAILAHDRVNGRGFSGEWGTGQRGGRWLVGFRLFEPTAGFQRVLLTDGVDRDLLEAIVDVPHRVALVPQATAGDANAETVLPSHLGRALIVDIEQRSVHVAHLLAPRGNN